jgi:hypothetical protein
MQSGCGSPLCPATLFVVLLNALVAPVEKPLASLLGKHPIPIPILVDLLVRNHGLHRIVRFKLTLARAAPWAHQQMQQREHTPHPMQLASNELCQKTVVEVHF